MPIGSPGNPATQPAGRILTKKRIHLVELRLQRLNQFPDFTPNSFGLPLEFILFIFSIKDFIGISDIIAMPLDEAVFIFYMPKPSIYMVGEDELEYYEVFALLATKQLMLLLAMSARYPWGLFERQALLLTLSTRLQWVKTQLR